MHIVLTAEEARELQRQEPESADDGGYQSLLVKMQNQLDQDTNRLELDDQDLERIPRYAYCYGQGGWESRLRKIFQRTLGPGLDRNAPTG